MATQTQASQINMFQNVDQFVTLNNVILLALPGFENVHELFKANLEQIYVMNENSNADISGSSNLLKGLKGKLTETTFSIGSKVLAYAINTGNEILKAEVDYSISDLEKNSFQNLVSISEVIYNRALANTANLTTYKITATVLQDFRKLIDDFRNAIPQTRTDIHSRMYSNQSLAGLIRENNEILAKEDALIRIVRESNPDLYVGFKLARKVVSMPTRHYACVGRVMDHSTQMGIKGALILFYQNSNAKPILEKRSYAKGGFLINNLPEGVYKVTIERPGYVTQTLTIPVSSSQATKLVVEMERS